MSLILVANATRKNLHSLCAPLKAAGYEVMTARNAKATLGLVVSHHPPIIAIGKKLAEKNCSFPNLLKALVPKSRVFLFDDSADGADILEAITL